MNLNSIAADRASAPQPTAVTNGGGESFQLAYAKLYDGRYAPGAMFVAPDTVPALQPQPAGAANTARAAPAAHTVHAGETLTGIARARLAALGANTGTTALRESIAQLAKANNLRNPDRIYAGQKLDLAALDSAFGRNQSAVAAAPAKAPVAPRDAELLFDVPTQGGARLAARYEVISHAGWHEEDMLPAEDAAVTAPAPLPVTTLPSVSTEGMAAIARPAGAALSRVDSVAARQAALYEQNAAAATDKPAEASRELPDIVYKGVAGKVLDALPIDASTRANLQRANSIVSSAFTARSLGALTGIGGPILTVAGLLWGIFSSRQIEAAPAAEAKPVPDTNPVVDAKQTAQTRVADALT